MKIAVVWIGRTSMQYVKDAVDLYAARLKHYAPIEIIEIPDIKNTKSKSVDTIRLEEGALLLKALRPDDYVVLLDDKGAMPSSVDLAAKIERYTSTIPGRLVFVVGGAYGFSLNAYSRANEFLSLSRMTFSHQMVRIVLLEQLYRAFTIIKKEPYHHEESLWNKK